MKYKILSLLLCIASLFLTSCGAMAQVAVTTTIGSQFGTFVTYHDLFGDYPVIYYQEVPYCRYFHNNVWNYRLIPFEHRHLIVHLDRPREFRHIPLHHRGHFHCKPSSTRHFRGSFPQHRHHPPLRQERNFHKR